MASNDPSESEISEGHLAETLADHRRAGEAYGVPRRFGIGTILVITTAVGLLLTVLQGVLLHPPAVADVVAFLCMIGVGQVLLFKGQQPRKASIIVGTFGVLLLTFVQPFVSGSQRVWFGFDPVQWAIGAFFGAFFGYVAGYAVAGVFLFADAIERFLTRWRREIKENDA